MDDEKQNQQNSTLVLYRTLWKVVQGPVDYLKL